MTDIAERLRTVTVEATDEIKRLWTRIEEYNQMYTERLDEIERLRRRIETLERDR